MLWGWKIRSIWAHILEGTLRAEGGLGSWLIAGTDHRRIHEAVLGISEFIASLFSYSGCSLSSLIFLLLCVCVCMFFKPVLVVFMREGIDTYQRKDSEEF